MFEIEKIESKVYHLLLPDELNTKDELWQEILKVIPEFLSEEITIFMDMQKINRLSVVGFNKLYDLVTIAHRNGAKVIFTNVRNEITERIGILSYSSE